MSLVERLAAARRWAGSSPVAVAALVAANLVPLVGVLVLGWDVLTILVLYWLENGMVGLFNIGRMLLAAGPAQAPAGRGPVLSGTLGKLVLISFFTLNYGIFWAVHGVFVFNLPLIGGGAVGDTPVGDLLVVGALALATSHGASFILNYLGRGEYRRTTPERLFLTPYGRLVVLHLTIILGGLLVGLVGGNLYLVALLVLLKTSLDLVLHLREHGRGGPFARPERV